jgi:hypothetical protein
MSNPVDIHSARYAARDSQVVIDRTEYLGQDIVDSAGFFRRAAIQDLLIDGLEVQFG